MKDGTYDKIKSHKKPGLYPFSREQIFGKTTDGLRFKCFAFFKFSMWRQKSDNILKYWCPD